MEYSRLVFGPYYVRDNHLNIFLETTKKVNFLLVFFFILDYIYIYILTKSFESNNYNQPINVAKSNSLTLNATTKAH